MENIDKKVVLNGKEIEVPEYKKIVLKKFLLLISILMLIHKKVIKVIAKPILRPLELYSTVILCFPGLTSKPTK